MTDRNKHAAKTDWDCLSAPEKLAQWAMWTFIYLLKYIEYPLAWPIMRSAAKQIDDTHLLDVARRLAQSENQESSSVRRLWGNKLTDLALAVDSNGSVTKEFRQAYIKRAPYVVVFGAK